MPAETSDRIDISGAPDWVTDILEFGTDVARHELGMDTVQATETAWAPSTATPEKKTPTWVWVVGGVAAAGLLFVLLSKKK